MSFWVIVLIAIGLAMDCFAVSLGVGTSPIPLSPRLIFRITYHFGLFQAGMTLVGWLAGSFVVSLIAPFDHWVAFALLGYVAIKMIIEGLQPDGKEQFVNDPSRGKSLVMLSVATSIDALAVGLSFALLQVNIWLSSLAIGLASTGLSLVGLLLGNGLSQRFGKRVEILGGIILLFIGLRILYTHLL
jgi:putative Mn2+ efflux pump MntP